MKRKHFIALFVLGVIQLTGNFAFANETLRKDLDEPLESPSNIPENIRDELEALPNPNDWQFHLAPLYVWFAGIEGESSLGPVTAPLDISFSDVFNNLEAVFTFHFEARKQNWAAFVDYMLLEVSPDQSAQFGSGPMGRPIGVDLDMDLRNDVVEFGGSYRIREAYPSVEILAGVRYTNLDISAVPAAKNVPLPLPPVNISEGLWDGFGGVRLIYEFGDNSGWSLIGKADVGGGSSDLTWSAMAAVDWQYKSWGSVRAGYKWLAYDYETGSGPSRFTYDVVYEGPIVGMVFNW